MSAPIRRSDSSTSTRRRTEPGARSGVFSVFGVFIGANSARTLLRQGFSPDPNISAVILGRVPWPSAFVRWSSTQPRGHPFVDTSTRSLDLAHVLVVDDD